MTSISRLPVAFTLGLLCCTSPEGEAESGGDSDTDADSDSDSDTDADSDSDADVRRVEVTDIVDYYGLSWDDFTFEIADEG